jgi:hypothetical protein
MYYILIFLASFFIFSKNISIKQESEEKESVALEKLIKRFCSYSIYEEDEICKKYFKK